MSVYNGKNVVTTLAHSFLIELSSFFAGNEDMHESLNEFKFPPDPIANFGVICPRASEKLMYNVATPLELSFLIGSFILAGKEDNHKSSDEFKFQLDPTSDCGVSFP